MIYMFNEDLMTAVSMWQNKNHIELLISIKQAGVYPEGYGDFLTESLQLAVREYLDNYGFTEEMK